MESANINELITRQLDRLEERTRDIVTRQDLAELRRELVAREALEPQLIAMRAQIVRVDLDRTTDKTAIEKRVDSVENALLSRNDRLWIRVTQFVGVSGFVVALFDFLSHLKVFP